MTWLCVIFFLCSEKLRLLWDALQVTLQQKFEHIKKIPNHSEVQKIKKIENLKALAITD